jgi:hypothetical protein
MMKHRNSIAFWAGVVVFLVAVLSMTQIVRNEYPFFAGYVILQFIAVTSISAPTPSSASASTRQWPCSRRRGRRWWCRSQPPRSSA